MALLLGLSWPCNCAPVCRRAPPPSRSARTGALSFAFLAASSSRRRRDAFRVRRRCSSEDFASWTKGRLKARLIELGATADGTRSDLVRRLRNSEAQATGESPRLQRKIGVRIWNGREIPWNLFSPKQPHRCTVVENHRQPRTLTKATGEADWETAHITLDHAGELQFLEGQAIGVIAPGPDKKGEVPAKIRLYSIASSAAGDDGCSRTLALCVSRKVVLDGVYANRNVGEDKADRSGSQFPGSKVYRGVCSNYLCDLNPGDEVVITGPMGTEMLLPEDPGSNLLLLATGTGIAPMRSLLRHLFHDPAGASADGSRRFKGLAWLFLGVRCSNSLLYDDEHTEYRQRYPENFRFDYALSREQSTVAGSRMHIQAKMAEYARELWDLLQLANTHLYLCGLPGIETGLAECFGTLAEEAGTDWAQFARSMKQAGRYHVEVY